MEYRCIFPEGMSAPVALYSIAAAILSVGLYYAISQYIMTKLMEKLYFLTAHWGIFDRSQFYYLLINLPLLMIGTVSLLYHRSLIGVEISLNIDEIQILLVSGFICWTEESRQTPLRGFIFFRDIIILLGALGIYAQIYYTGTIDYTYAFIFFAYFFVFYILQHISNRLEDMLLRALGIREPDIFNAEFLLTQRNHEGDVLGIRDIVSNNEELVSKQINQFDNMLASLVDNVQDHKIMKNFGRIFLSIKTARQLLEYQNNKENEQCVDQAEINECSVSENKVEQENVDQQCNFRQSGSERDNSFSGSGGSLGHNDSAHAILAFSNTKGTDLVNEKQDQEEELHENSGYFQRTIKYVYYPVYLLSLPEGRVRYLSDYLGLFMLGGAMFVITNTGYYFSYHNSHNLSLPSLVLSGLLVYPPASYFTRISAENDFDLINMFLQAAVFKLTFFSFIIAVASFIGTSSLQSGVQNLILLLIRVLTYIVLSIFMASKRFATRHTNFRFFILIFVLQHLARTLVQIIFKAIYQ